MFEEPEPVGAGGTAPVAQSTTQEPPQAVEPQNYPTQPCDQSPQQAADTIRIAGSGVFQQLSTLVGFLILGVFFVLEYMGYLLNFYYFIIFFVLIIAVPTLMRMATSVIKFSGPNFSFRGSSSQQSYSITDVENVTIDQYNRQDQTITINFKVNRPPLQVEFTSIAAFRTVIVAFSRRRIVVIPPSRTQNNPNSGS